MQIQNTMSLLEKRIHKGYTTNTKALIPDSEKVLSVTPLSGTGVLISSPQAFAVSVLISTRVRLV